MISTENLKKIEEITKEFFAKTGFEAEISVKQSSDLIVSIDLEMEEPQILIGEGGRTLAEIQRLIIAILRRKIPSAGPGQEKLFYIDVDIQGYKKKKNEYLKDLAQSAADEVSLSKKERILPPMPAYERRIIHLELAERKDITSESIGQEPERRVVIRSSP